MSTSATIYPYPIPPIIRCLSSASANLFSKYTTIACLRLATEISRWSPLFGLQQERAQQSIPDSFLSKGVWLRIHSQWDHRMPYFEDQVISNHPLVRVYSGFHMCLYIGLQFDPYQKKRLGIVLVFMVSVRFG